MVQRGALVGTVRANGTLSLTQDGKPVKILAAGRYTLTVRDRSHSSGFTLQAARSDPITLTAGPFVGTKSKALTLGRGQWLFYGSFVGKKYSSYGLVGTAAGDRPTVRRRRSSTIATPEIASRSAAQPPT